MKKSVFILLSLAINFGWAQNSIQSGEYAELSAFESFQSQNYQEVVGELKNRSSRTQDEQILLLLSELKTGKAKSEEIEQWLQDNAKHPLKSLATFHLGEYYFYSGDTLSAKKNLATISRSDLGSQDKGSYGFVYGVIQLSSKNYKQAKNLFQFARANGFKEPLKLSYFEAFADYHLGNIDEALEGFAEAKDDANFGLSSKFFISKIKLDNGELDDVISISQGELSDDKTRTNSAFHQLIGEAYALKNNVAKADAFFQRAIELHPGKPSAALYYQAGVAKFKIGNEDKAIAFLTSAGIQGGEYAQLSAFQLGRLYLKKRDFERALTAYIEASTSDDMAIKEESYYQAAMINAQLGFFADAINYSTDYLKNFKNGSKVEAIQNLIAQSYLRTSNYDLAIEHLNAIGVTTNTQKEVYQKVAFQKAAQSFNDGNFADAEKWFRQSLRFTPDQSLKNSSNYHLAEISLRNGRFNEAIGHYKNQSQLDPMSNYGIGYAYFNQQQYPEALPYFRSATKAQDKTVKQDANVRLADCLFATKNYSEALTIYSGVSTQVGSAYVIFQKGMTYKNLGDRKNAIQEFKDVFSSQKYGADARFQVGMIHFESAEFSEAERYFTQVISNHPNSTYVIESLLNRGVSRKNLGQLKEAQTDYEKILSDYINSEVALNAILGLQELQQSGQSVNNLDKHIANFKKANPENGSLELIEFEAAKRFYFDFAYEKAVSALQKFLKDYTTSSSKQEAKYYLADSYYRLNNLREAKSAFDELKYVKNSFTGRILSRLGDINRQLKNVKESEEAYQLLVDLNLTAKDTYNARQGLMYLYFENSQYEKAIQLADEILKAEWKPLNAENEAILIKAKSWLNLESLPAAKSNFEILAGGDNVFAAEANYYIGHIQFTQNENEASLNTLFDLNSKFGNYSQWVDKSYLLIARNYIIMEELFQAKATLRSIIQHSKNQEIVNESQQLLNAIEQNVSMSDSTQNKN
ncbi:tetratricopeptide repeat protein [Ekhidna sp.]|uniref:tetratricopeptide repeat protein n=1 Tax=Ekhidna sp. TaxID=2608089 RepID=UPI0035144240